MSRYFSSVDLNDPPARRLHPPRSMRVLQRVIASATRHDAHRVVELQAAHPSHGDGHQCVAEDSAGRLPGPDRAASKVDERQWCGEQSDHDGRPWWRRPAPSTARPTATTVRSAANAINAMAPALAANPATVCSFVSLSEQALEI